MADLNELLRLAREHRDAADATGRALTAEAARLAALREQAANLERRVDPHEGQGDQLAQVRKDIAASEAKVADLRGQKRGNAAEWNRIGGLLEPVLDPRRAISGLDANYPILLFPVRLETRFISSGAIANNARSQLLVRVYPDDCAVDSFEPELSEDEVKNLQRYWCGIWSAGGDESREQSAWRELCAAHGAGRALYLIQQYKPLPDSDPVPPRASASEVILAAPADAALMAAERSSLAVYWTAAWRAGKNGPALAAAFQALSLAVTAPRAEVLRKSYVPFNAQDPPAAGVDRAVVPVSTVFVSLTPAATAATKRQAWTRPPQAALLPERFVLVADSGPEHIEVLGGIITQPLDVGPDPLADQADQFQKDGGDLIVPEPLRWMTDFNEALKAGMAFRIDLTARQASEGFDRLYVLGVRLDPDPQQSRADFEQLLGHHASGQSGFAIVPQGTATNNSEEGSTGWTRVQEADELFPLSRMFVRGRLAV